MKTIGLTGNSGSGKSEVAQLLKAKGALVIDADKIAHEVVLKGHPSYNDLLEYFGHEILGEDFEINRKVLGGIVFNNKEKMQKLVEITHRDITKEMLSLLKNASDKYPYVVLDAPLLIEAQLHKAVDEVWVVYADHETRMTRLLQRDKLSEEQILARLNSQTPFEELKKYADVIIENEGNIERLELEIENVLRSERK